MKRRAWVVRSDRSISKILATALFSFPLASSQFTLSFFLCKLCPWIFTWKCRGSEDSQQLSSYSSSDGPVIGQRHTHPLRPDSVPLSLSNLMYFYAHLLAERKGREKVVYVMASEYIFFPTPHNQILLFPVLVYLLYWVSKDNRTIVCPSHIVYTLLLC